MAPRSSGDLGAATVAPKCLVLRGCASVDDIDVNFGIREFLLRVGLCSDIVLSFGGFYCTDFKSGTRNATEIHNLGETEDLGAPVWAPK